MKNRTLSHDPMVGRIVAWSKVNETRCVALKATNTIDIFGPIGDMGIFADSITAQDVSEALNDAGDSDELDVRLNTPGGVAYDGIAIYNLLRSARQKINIKIIGVAASAGSVIAMAGDTVEMSTGSQLMIHKAHGRFGGNEADMRVAADVLKELDANMVDIYHAKTGIDREKLTAMLHPDTYMSAAKAVELGFADSIATAAPAQARAPIQPTAMSRLFLGHG